MAFGFSFIILAAGVLVLLLLVALGLVAIVLSERAERGTVIAIVVVGGLLLLLCACAVAGLVWFFTAGVSAQPHPPPIPTISHLSTPDQPGHCPQLLHPQQQRHAQVDRRAQHDAPTAEHQRSRVR